MALRSIGIAFSFNLAYCRRMLAGIKDFARGRGDWGLVALQAGPGLASAVRGAGVDGLIAHAYSVEIARAIKQTALPAVNVSGLVGELGIARVGIDNPRVGRMAARHFLERGFTRLAFLGHEGVAASSSRESGYLAEAAEAGVAASVFRLSSRRRFAPEANASGMDAAARAWVQSLPPRTGMFAYCDILAVEAMDACRRCGRRVPEEVSLLGVDDDDLLGDLAWVPLSSVQVPADAIGRHAAIELQRQFEGHPPRAQPLLFPPMGIAVRRSSSITAVADPLVATTIARIHEGFAGALDIGTLLAGADVGRRTLERRFRAAIGRGMWDEIRRIRLEAAMRLLANTDLPMAAIASRSGFSDAKRLSMVMRAALEVAPRTYRRRYRAG